MKNNMNRLPMQKEFIRWQNYPIIRNGDRYDSNLFFDRGAKCPVFEFPHYGFFFRYNSSFWKNNETLSFIQRLHRLDHGGVAALESFAIYGNVKPPVHKAKQRNILHIILPYKNCIQMIEAQRRDIDIRKMIRTKDILRLWIKGYFVNHFER